MTDALTAGSTSGGPQLPDREQSFWRAARVRVDGKFFSLGAERFRFHGVTYGTFRPRRDGSLFPPRDQVERDFEAMRDHGVTVVRTYTAPSDDVVELASAYGLYLLAGVFYSDWRYLLGGGVRQLRRVGRDAAAVVHREARRLSGEPAVLGVSVGNEIPADVVRWYGRRPVQMVIARLADEVRRADDQLLVTYANYPTAEYLELADLDFVTFNVFLERREDFRRYLTRLHHLAGDRPLVLGEIGLHAGTAAGGDHDAPGSAAPPGPSPEGEARQAETLGWQLSTAIERGVAGACVFSWTDEWNVGGSDVEGWSFGLTRTDRTPRPALEVFRHWSQKSVRDLRDHWPRLSVVVCAYNAASTLEECLLQLCASDYPDLEVLVVDDGSTDETPAIALRHARVRLVAMEHAGLASARNAGCAAASGDIVAYLDADAFPSPEWPYYLVLAFDGSKVAAAGGPNLPPASDGVGAQVVARAPGGPVHVLLTDDRAEHVPGCNMAFWKELLVETGGFDPIYTSAGDDVDACWKILDRGWEIGFHPAALVWHHRRPGLRLYLRQQVGYGRAEALVERRHPDRVTPTGTARWRGRIYDSLVPAPARPRIYRGLYGSAAYQSIYGGGGYALDLAHQLGIPLALVAVLVALFFLPGWLGVVVLCLGLASIVGLGVVDAALVRLPRGQPVAPLRFRAAVAACRLLQPLARLYGWERERARVTRNGPPAKELPTVRPAMWGVFIFPDLGGRPPLVASIVSSFRAAGMRVFVPSGWEPYDARVSAGVLLTGELLSSAHPEGCVQVRVRARLRPRVALVVAIGLVFAWLLSLPAAITLTVLVAVELARGLLIGKVWTHRVLSGRSR
ncbi:MAG: glycosyltransferase [Acidimicrobiales bacterium]|nr:glycosyltransferase [Acidimicrobiales bacterium]